MNEQILAELKKMNEFLAKIDWKMWNLHQKFMEGKDIEGNFVAPPSQKVTAPAPVTAKEPASIETAEVPKYPSIEKWN